MHRNIQLRQEGRNLVTIKLLLLYKKLTIIIIEQNASKYSATQISTTVNANFEHCN